tara:strand:+ start:13 stop:291 length:279 start_codon:yes stop_codon:yes gene_type:complete
MNDKNIKCDYKLVLCYWKDIVSQAEWSELEDAKKREPVDCVTVGWVVRQDENTTVLASEFNFKDNKIIDSVGNTTSIPTANIIGMKTLRTKI